MTSPSNPAEVGVLDPAALKAARAAMTEWLRYRSIYDAGVMQFYGGEVVSAAIQAYLAASPPADTQGAGWVLVPREPTEAMIVAGIYASADNTQPQFGDDVERTYRTMLAASAAEGPKPPLPDTRSGLSSSGEREADRDSIRFARQFADMYRSGAQGAEMDCDAAQALALSIDDILSALTPAREEGVTEVERFPKTLGLIHQAIDTYVNSMVAREHAGIAQDCALTAICNALGRSPMREMDARRRPVPETAG